MVSNLAFAARVRVLSPAAATAFLILSAGCGHSTSVTAPAPLPSSDPTPVSVTVGVAANAAPVLAPGAHLQLWAVASYSDQSSRDVTNIATWQSSNPSIATLTRDGLLAAATEGSVDVVATVGRVAGSLHATIERPGCKASTLSLSALTFNAFEHFASVVLTTPQADCRWIAKSDADWLRLGFGGVGRGTFDPGQSGSGTLSYSVVANTFPEARTGHVTIEFTDGTQLVHSVAQEHPVSCSYVITPDDGYFHSSGGVGSFDVSTTPADCQWRATANYSSYGIRLTSSGSGTGAAHVTYAVDRSFDNYPREGSIVIAGLSGANPPAVHKIHIAVAGQ